MLVSVATMSEARPPRGPEPPAGPPWDVPLHEAELAFVDLEMTGLDARKDRVVEICIERVRGDVVLDRMETLVHPGPGKVGNAHIHGIDEAAVASAPPFDSIAERVLALCEGAILVAHAAPWDVAFLEAELARSGRPHHFPFYLDTLTLSRRVFALPSHALESLADALHIERGRSHRAGEDVRVLRAIFDEVAKQLQPTTARDLWYVRVGQRVARPEIVAACLRAVEGRRPVWLSFRPARKPATTFEACITQVRTDLDPPRVMGYSLPGRGRFDVRADRILSVVTAAPPKAAPPPREPEPKPR